jgi:MoaA/NifB/PqqE/SkfB family radical SAM enzyme
VINELWVRIDSLNAKIYHWSTGLILWGILDNIKYFASKNDYIKFGVIYFPLYKYEEYCLKYLNKKPTYFDVNRLKEPLEDEWETVKEYFSSIPSKRKIEFMYSGICLWGEREDVTLPSNPVPCTRLPENDGAFDNLVLIYPNGDVGLCAYDDYQDTFILGNILKDSLADIWNGEKRQQFISSIRNGKYLGKYPCSNPACCYFYNTI